MAFAPRSPCLAPGGAHAGGGGHGAHLARPRRRSPACLPVVEAGHGAQPALIWLDPGSVHLHARRRWRPWRSPAGGGARCQAADESERSSLPCWAADSKVGTKMTTALGAKILRDALFTPAAVGVLPASPTARSSA
nr:unnamed protein product [Digitaria exilis]CAB3503018.1 unnamed protein product [Digitaria exilis]